MAHLRFRSARFMDLWKTIIYCLKVPAPPEVTHTISVLLVSTLNACPVDLGAGVTVHELAIDVVGEKVIPTPRGSLTVPSRPHETIEWVNNSAGDLRVLVDRKV